MKTGQRIYSAHSLVQLKLDNRDLGALVDNSMKPIGTCCLLAGLATAAFGIPSATEYLLAAGVLLHLVSWFGDFWEK